MLIAANSAAPFVHNYRQPLGRLNFGTTRILSVWVLFQLFDIHTSRCCLSRGVCWYASSSLIPS